MPALPPWLDGAALWLAAGAVLLALAALVWLRRRPWRGARARYPFVLAHGLLGFTSIGVGPIKEDYFRGIADHLQSLGLTVYNPQVPLVASVAERGEALARAVRALPDKRVNIIAHSMGGLDARYAISALGLAPRVASLTTIGTPHRGTPIADAGAALLGPLRKLLPGVGLGAFADLTSEALARFNREVQNVRGVRYASVVASLQDGDIVHPLLQPSKAFLDKRDILGDGVVPAASQTWGRVIARIRADHWAEIGWGSGLDAPAFYEDLARWLRARGC